MAYEPTNGDLKRLYKAIGFKIKSRHDGVDIDDTVIGLNEVPAIYLKFMSDGGKLDDANGKALKAYLTARGVAFDSTRDRVVILAATDFERLFGKGSQVQGQVNDLGVDTWMKRAGPEYNDSAEQTVHERFMEEEIAALREKLAAAQKQISGFQEIEEEIHRRAGKEGTETSFTVTITPEQYAVLNEV